jgi:hypothetical protein
MSQKNKNWINPIIHDRQVVGKIFDWMKENELHKNKFKKPEDLTILTCRNDGEMYRSTLIPSLSKYTDVSILESNLEYLGIKGLVVLRDTRMPWRNTFKFEMIHNYLQSGKCKTKYFMFCDAVDVIFQQDPQKVIDIFESVECEALFMSTDSIDGYNCMPDVQNWVDNLNGGIGRYMNTGVYIGKTSFIKEIISEAMKYAIPHGTIMDEHQEYLKSNPVDFPRRTDDQCILRFLEPKFYPRLKVDYENLMAYRTWSGVQSGHGLVLNTEGHEIVE